MAEPTTPSERTVVVKDEALRQFEGGFTSIPNRILENNDLTLGARMTYAMLLKYAWQKDFCFPAQQQLAKDLGITDRSVRTFLGELRERSLIDWKQRGLNRPNIYYILRLPARTPSNDGGQPGPEEFSGPDRKSTSTPERKQLSGQERKQASDKEDSGKKTHHVNVNVGLRTPKKRNPETDTPAPPKQARRWKLTPEQLNEAQSLAETIAETIGQRQNLRSYFTLAADALEAGHRESIFQALGLTKEERAAGRIRTTPSQYFHATLRRLLPPPEPAEEGRTAGEVETLSPEEEEQERALARATREAFLAKSKFPSPR